MLKKIKSSLLVTLSVLCALVFGSCKDMIYENEGDCTPKYRIKFIYDKNWLNADAFSQEVTSVNLYVFDSEGIFVKEFDAAGASLAEPGFAIEFDGNELDPGKYTFIAWCGLVNDGVAMESFTVPQPQPGVTTKEELICTLNTMKTAPEARSDSDEAEYSDTDLKYLFHGMMEAELVDNRDGLTTEYTMYLTKDTTHIRIILQQLSGDNVEKDEFNLDIRSADGRLAYDNALLPYNPVVTYLPWAKEPTQMALTQPDGSIRTNYGLITDLTTSRIMASEKETYMLRVTEAESQKVLISTPVIEYILLGKADWISHHNHGVMLSDQEFLDHVDECTLTFFLLKDQWVGLQIDILEWRVVYSEYEVG